MRSSASPGRLRRFAQAGAQLDGPLLRTQRDLSADWVWCRRASPGAADGADPGDRLAALRAGANRLDHWVSDVGSWFDAADQGTFGSLPAALVARVMAPLTVLRSQWPAPIVVGYNPLDAPRRGTFDAAGYGDACSGNHTGGTSIMGPDGLGYPVVVPGPAGTAQESLDWMPSAALDPAMADIDDTGRTWTTVSYSEAVVSPRNGTGYKVAGAIAATAGWVAVSGPSASAADIGRVLRVEPSGRPHLVPAATTPTRSSSPPTPEEVAPAPRAMPAKRAISAANMADLAMSAVGGWRAASNEGAGFVQAQYQRDAVGHRRVLVRGYEVRVVDGVLQVSSAYWNGRSWVPLGTPTLRATPVITAA